MPSPKHTHLFCAVLIGAGLAACGSGEDPAAAPVPVSQPALPPAPAPTPPSPPTPTPTPPPVSATACPAPSGRVLEVGPGKTLTKPSAAAAMAQNGDTIHIAAGDYRGDATTWRASNLTICGIGGKARLFADGVHAQGKGTWVIAAPNSVTTTIVNVEFHNAKVPDQNGAGIRLDGGSLVLRRTGFYDNENGILSGGGPVTVTIENSEFARNGFGDGFTHNLYIGNVDRLNVRSSFFHEARIGHNLKSRAKENFIENSYFMDGATGTASYLLDFPDGGVLFMRGNLLHKGPNADNTTSVAYGFERNMYANNTVTLIHNTLATTQGRGTFVGVAGYAQSLTLTANLFAGTAAVSSGVAGSKLVQQNNVTTTIANLPGSDLIAAPSFWPAAAVRTQLQLSAAPDAQYVNDSPQPYALRPLSGMSGRMIGALQAQP